MEGAAFYETSARFSTGELIHCLKIVSDNESSPLHTIQPKSVSELIDAKLTLIDSLLQMLIPLSDSLNQSPLPQYEQLLNQYHFTVTQQLQLKKLLTRWQLLKDDISLTMLISSVKNSTELLQVLNTELNSTDFYL
jgi:adenosylhomocysteine nucleosidase